MYYVGTSNTYICWFADKIVTAQSCFRCEYEKAAKKMRMSLGRSRTKDRAPLQNNIYVTSQMKENASNNNNSGFTTAQENRNPLYNSSCMTSQENKNPLYSNANGSFCFDGTDEDFDEFMSGQTVCSNNEL